MPTTVRDPVCGMPVSETDALVLERGGTLFHFCSNLCLRQFVAAPQTYGAATSGLVVERSARRIAYFSMEVAFDARVPTYSGGLGVLAGDVLRAAADLRLPLVGVSLVHRKGYFRQSLDAEGRQKEEDEVWRPEEHARPLGARTEVVLEGARVQIRAWQHDMRGCTGATVPLLLLDTDVPENEAQHRDLTSHLYGGDEAHRLAQEAVLGIGGLRMLRALGYDGIERFHMNEGHSSLLGLELLREISRSSRTKGWDFKRVRERCVFTTHTPVPAGHDRFGYDLIRRLLGDTVPDDVVRMLAGSESLNMTLLAMNLSQYVNGVAKRHGEVSREMFPGHVIDSVTNGVHPSTWASESLRSVYDRHIPGWCTDPFALRKAVHLPRTEVWEAHQESKLRLLDFAGRRGATGLRPDVLTLGFARRATQYKRMSLVFQDLDALRVLARRTRGLQLVFAGKAHPRDEPGKDLIRRVFACAEALRGEVEVVYLEDYDVALARLLTAGVDVWLNTPQPPMEASGTSGMKAALNGIPSLSVLDGWWLEGHIEGLTGWSIGAARVPEGAGDARDRADAEDLYRKLGEEIAPLYYGNRERWIDLMRHCIALNGSFFSSQRMLLQYAASAYL